MLAAILTGSTGLSMEVPAEWLEGDDEVRARLADVEGKPAPALDVTQWINTEPLRMSALKGKIVVLEFWSTMSNPSLKYLAQTMDLHARYADKGVVFISICSMHGAPTYDLTVRSQRLLHPVCLDQKGLTENRYAAEGYPDYYFIDRAGIVRVADSANTKVEEILSALLAEQPAHAAP